MAPSKRACGLDVSGAILSAFCGITMLCITGCGIGPGNESFAMPLVLMECGGQSGSHIAAADLVVLDWSGGTSNLYPDDYFEGLDFPAFETPSGGSLADDVEGFKEAVRLEATRILCDMPDARVRVENAKRSVPHDVTIVQFAQVLSPQGPGQIGQGEYDPCNVYHDDVAVVFGEELLHLGGPYTFDEWVLMFANVTAHEIGHMLGYGHVERQDHAGIERSRFVELMLAVHTVEEMVREQRLLADDTNCPFDGSSTMLKRVTHGHLVCGIAVE